MISSDFPCILSNEDVLLLDPHMVIDPTGGLIIGLEDFVTSERVASHLESLRSYFGYNCTRKYDGTIFRFPLRTGLYETSLPNNVYNARRVIRSLFEPFRKEVENCLLFMKTVQSVKVSVKDSSGIRLLYSVKVDASFRERLNLHRKEIFEFIENEYHIQSSKIFISLFSTNFIDFDQTKTVRLWLVMNTLGLPDQAGRSGSRQFESYLPWFAVALPLPLPLPHSQHTLHSILDQDCCWSEEFIDTTLFFRFIDNNIPSIPLSCEVLNFIGNLFCFLPIAASSKFPFHIHGYFALSTNRRSIKWPRFDDLSDEAKWNKDLVEQLGTISYAVLIHLAVSRFRTQGRSMLHYSLWSCLPSDSETDELQSIIHSGALHILRNSKLVCSKLDSTWIELCKGYYLPSSFGRTIPHEEVCTDLLLKLSLPVVELTPEVSNVIRNYEFLEQQISELIISPTLMRHMLFRFQNDENLLDILRQEEKVCSLLEVVLCDLNFSSQDIPKMLNGIRLIPVCNSDLPMIFGNRSAARYYISEGSQDFLKLFPGLERLFVKRSLPHPIRSSLLDLSGPGFINIENITNINTNPEYFVNFLENSMKCFFDLGSPIVWNPGTISQPDKSWIEQLWKFIDQDYSIINVLKRRSMPILPKQALHTPQINLLPLSTTTMPYLEHSAAPAHSEIEQLIASSGCHVCHRHIFILPYYQFVLPPIPQGLLSILKLPTIQGSFRQKISNADDSIRQSLINLLLSLDFTDNNEINIIKSLPLFISMSKEWITLNSVTRYCLPPDSVLQQMECYPTHFLNPFINQNVKLCWKVGINSISLEDAIQFHLLPLISSNSLWNKPNERKQLSIWILKNYSLYTPIFLSILSTTKWLLDSCTDSNQAMHGIQLYSPTNLFDPQDVLISQLLPSNMRGVFPNEIYSRYITNLKSSGLMSSANLDYQNLENIIRLALQNVKNVTTENFPNWMNALVELLSLYFTEFDLNPRIWNIFMQTYFIIPSPRNHCSYYPRSLPFFPDSNHFFKPSQVTLCSDRESCLLAGVQPLLVDRSDPSKNYAVIYQRMGFQTDIAPSLVCKQLILITQQSSLKHSEIHSYVKKIYKYFSHLITSNRIDLVYDEFPANFVYIPEFGFYDTDHVVLSCDNKLFPYVFSLEKYYPPYEENLTLFFRHFNVESEISFSKCQMILQQLQNFNLPPNKVSLAVRVVQISADLIQMESPTPHSLVLAQNCMIFSAGQCVFNDLAWMKRSQLSTHKHIVHSGVSNTIASKIGCLPASLEMTPTAESISYSFISDAGQSEDLVQRLRGILEGYRVHSDVFLELIQNSDDAGAKQVKILFDYTSHPCSSVLHKNMERVHGPALYVFNDSKFTDQDFASILKLSSGNKLNDTAKIGRFGVGFNAVYNFTDCPSFVSDRLVQIFDPLREYIGPLSRDSGIRLRFTDDEAAISTFRDQFRVYQDIFECDILNHNPYEYTLFRLPFRINPSQLSDKVFKPDAIAKLQASILQELPLLLLFLQNVNRIEVYERTRVGIPFKKLLIVSKNECSTTHFLQENKQYFENYLHRVQSNSPRLECPISTSDLLSIHSEFPNKKHSQQNFLIAYASGVGECFDVLQRFNYSDVTFLPSCGVAIPINFLQSLPDYMICKLYTFLPLPIRSPMPLHINGYFSLSSSRKNLSDVDVSSSEEVTDLRTDWNIAIVNDALSNALICALEALPLLEPLCSSRQAKHYENYYSLWPVKDNPYIIWKAFPEYFARRIVESFPSTKLFSCAHDPSVWVSFDEISFLSVNHALDSDFLQFIYTIAYQRRFIFAFLPSFFMSTKIYKVFSELKPEKVFNLRKICELFIFPKLPELPLEMHTLIFNSLTPLCNEDSEDWLLDALCNIAFIPCGSIESGFQLRKPSEVVCPNTKIASLYQRDEMRIPASELHEHFDLSKPDLIPTILKRMGVIYDRLPECEVISRCLITSNPGINDPIRHATTLIEYLSHEDESFFNSIYPKIKSIPFIPTHKDDLFEIFSIPYIPFTSPDNCYTFLCRYLISPLHPCASCDIRPIAERFHILNDPSLEIVLEVLGILISNVDPIRSQSFKIEKKIQEIYTFISEIVTGDESEMLAVKEKLKDEPWIWHPDYKQFYTSNQAIISQEFHSLDKNKYIIAFPFSDILRDENFKRFLIEVGVKEHINDITIIECLQSIREDFTDESLQPNIARLVIKLIELIENCEACSSFIFLLSQINVLHSPSELYVTLSPHLMEEDSNLFVHPRINPMRALQLDARVSEEMFSSSRDLDESDFGIEEEITDRIQSLVRDIPMDALIKELIQNAEDAEATEIVFILDAQDYTEHRKTLLLPGGVYLNWKHLHSFPSLSVYNNKGFTEGDFKGIQALSVGGKTEDRNSIGKFGLGFNSVYQITDAPTFITTQNGQEAVTFCCFDPFIKYTNKSYQDGRFKRKRGKRFEIPSQNFAKFSDQLIPFKFANLSDNPEFADSLTNLWQNGEFTMFRFPLDIASNSSNPEFTQLIPYKKVESRKHCSLSRFSRMLIKQIKDNSEMLLFLKNVKSLKVISINKTGVAKLEFSQSLEVSEPQFESMPAYFPHSGIGKKIAIEKVQCINTLVSSNYLVYSCPSFTVEEYITYSPELEKYSKRYCEEKMRGFGGIAVKISDFESAGILSSLFTSLPVGSRVNLPVHLNAPLIIDASRQHIHDESIPWGEAWHSSIIECILVPLYTMLLVQLRKPLDNAKEKKKYFEWFYSLFPDESQNIFLSKLSKTLYSFLYKTNQPILLCDHLDMLREGDEPKWYTLRGPDYGVFRPILIASDKSKVSEIASEPRKYKHDVPMPHLHSVQNRDVSNVFECKPKMLNLRKPLILIKFPLTFAPIRLFYRFEEELVMLDQSLLLTYLRDNIDYIFQAHAYPCSLNSSVLNFENFITILEYLLSAGDEFFAKLPILPMRIDIRNNIRCFRKDRPSFLHTFYPLLPHRSERFISSEYNWNIRHKMKMYGYVENLNCDYLSKYLDIERFTESKQYCLFWEFVVHNNLSQQDLCKFNSHRIVPLCSEENSFFLVQDLKFIVTPTLEIGDPILYKALRALECPRLSFDFFKQQQSKSKIEKYLDSIAISDIRPPDVILGSLSFASKLSACLQSEEVEKLLLIFCQGDVIRKTVDQLNILSQLKIFETHSGAYVALNQCRICYINCDKLLLGSRILEILEGDYGLVIFRHYREELLKGLCHQLQKQLINIDALLMTKIFPNLFNIPFQEQMEIISFISQKLAGYDAHRSMGTMLNKLSDIAFICHEGEYRRVRYFYSAEIAFFTEFLPYEILPEEWRDKSFKDLFDQLGLRNEISLDDILIVAEKFSKDEIPSESLPHLLGALETLLSKCDFKLNQKSIESLTQIGQLEFLPVWKIEDINSNQRIDSTQLVRFCDAQLNQFRNCCCTTAWIHEYAFHIPSQFFQHLEIMKRPDVELVKEHLMKITKQITFHHQLTNIPSFVDQYFFSSYGYLEEHSSDTPDLTFHEFHGLPCILWQSKLYYPINMLFSSSEDLSPFVIQIPPDLASRYKKFLEKKLRKRLVISTSHLCC